MSSLSALLILSLSLAYPYMQKQGIAAVQADTLKPSQTCKLVLFDGIPLAI